MPDELPIAERAAACRMVLDRRGYLYSRPPAEADAATIEAARRRFMEVADHLNLEATEVADNGLLAWPRGEPRPDLGGVERRASAYLN